MDDGQDTDYYTHIEPVDDWRPHDTVSHGDCACKPTLEECEFETQDGEMLTGYIVVHNSYDGREHKEPDHEKRLCDWCIEREIKKHEAKFKGMSYEELWADETEQKL